MYTSLKAAALRFLRLPERPPDPPKDGYQSVQVFRASQRWLRYRLCLFWLGFALTEFLALFLLLGALIGGQAWVGLGIGVVALAVALLFLAGWFCVRIEYDLRTYVVTDRSLRVRQGAWIFKEMTLTYANVQNVQVTQGPLQRLFKIEDLRVDTAGGGGSGNPKAPGETGHYVVLAGLENAREVRDLILSYVKVAGRGSGLGDLDDPEHASARSRLNAPAVLEALAALRATTQGLRAAIERRTRPI